MSRIFTLHQQGYRENKQDEKDISGDSHTWALSMRSARSSSLVRLRLDTCTRCSFRRRAGILSITSSWQGGIMESARRPHTPNVYRKQLVESPQATKNHSPAKAGDVDPSHLVAIAVCSGTRKILYSRLWSTTRCMHGMQYACKQHLGACSVSQNAAG